MSKKGALDLTDLTFQVKGAEGHTKSRIFCTIDIFPVFIRKLNSKSVKFGEKNSKCTLTQRECVAMHMNDDHWDQYEYDNIDDVRSHASTFTNHIGRQAFFDQQADGDGHY